MATILDDARAAVKRSEANGGDRDLRDALRALIQWADAANDRMNATQATARRADLHTRVIG